MYTDEPINRTQTTRPVKIKAQEQKEFLFAFYVFSLNGPETQGVRPNASCFILFLEVDFYWYFDLKKKQPRPVDLSDFKSISESFARNGDLPTGVLKLDYRFDQPVFCLENFPGFYFIPAALSIEEQCRWIKESLVSFLQSPNRTNHDAVYGGIHDLFNALKNRQVLIKEDSVADDVTFANHKWASSDELDSSVNGDNCKPVSASVLLRKLRWSTLGLQFNWSKFGVQSYFSSWREIQKR